MAGAFDRIIHKQRRDAEMTEELESHLQMHIEDNLRSGMTPQEARRHALIRLGGDRADERGIPRPARAAMLENLMQDLRYGFRVLLKNPGFRRW